MKFRTEGCKGNSNSDTVLFTPTRHVGQKFHSSTVLTWHQIEARGLLYDPVALSPKKGAATGYPHNTRFAGPQSPSRHFLRSERLVPQNNNERHPRLSSLQLSHFTDCSVQFKKWETEFEMHYQRRPVLYCRMIILIHYLVLLMET
jgi:hypothetical protein